MELQSFAQDERDVRRRHLRPVGQRRRGRSGAHQRDEPQLVHDDVGAHGQRGALHLLAREPPAHGCRLRSARRHRHGVRAVIPFRRSVLPPAERRRAHLADADQGQHLDRHRQAHVQGRRRVDAHAQRSGVSWLLYRPVHLRQRDRLPALRVAGGRGWIRSQHGWLLERDVCHVPDGVPGGIDDRRRTAPSVSPGCGSHRSRHRRGRRVGHLERRVFALRAGFVAGPAEPDAELRPALGLAADARDGRSHDDGVWRVSRRPDVPL